MTNDQRMSLQSPPPYYVDGLNDAAEEDLGVNGLSVNHTMNGNGDEDSSSIRLHPLLVDTVLTQLVPYIRISDMKSCRQVCTKWNYALLPRFKKTFAAEISVYKFSNSKRYLKNWNVKLTNVVFWVPFKSYLTPQFGVLPKTVEEFVEDMRDSKQVPFTKFTLSDFPWKTQVADDFFWLCGPTLTEFTPWLQMNGRQWDLGDLRNLLLYHCPRLEKLYVSPSPQWFRKQRHFFPPTGGDIREYPTFPSINEIVINAFRAYPVEFLRDLFGAAINLQKLNLRCHNEEDVQGPGQWPEVSVLGALEWAGREKTLNSLVLVDISDKMMMSLIHLSTNSTLRLKRFTWVYQRDECQVSCALVHKFLNCQKHNLEYLMLDQLTKYDPVQPPFLFEFPEMSQLKLFSYGHERSDCLLTPLDLAKNFPCLKTLQTGHYSDEGYFSARMNTFDMGNFWRASDPTQISTFHIHKPVLARDIATMTHLMPLVTRLKIVIYSREALTQIWRGWPNLISLSLSHRCIKDIDCAFTGIPKEEYFRLVTENNFQGDAVSLAVGPSIRDLQG